MIKINRTISVYGESAQVQLVQNDIDKRYDLTITYTNQSAGDSLENHLYVNDFAINLHAGAISGVKYSHARYNSAIDAVERVTTYTFTYDGWEGLLMLGDSTALPGDTLIEHIGKHLLNGMLHDHLLRTRGQGGYLCAPDQSEQQPVMFEVEQADNITNELSGTTATVVVTDGAAPFTYALDGNAPGTDNVITNLSAGLHTIVVTDAQGVINSRVLLVP